MKAVVIEGPNRVAFREVDAPAVGPDDVLIKSIEAGLCRTDIEMMTGAFTDPHWVHYPVIPGHEWAGTVLEVGSDVEGIPVGARVVCEGLIPCTRCRRCRSGETHWCERIEALGFTRLGGYAELVAAPARVVHQLPDHISFDAGVLIEPASVVMHALEKVRPQPGEAVGVIGVGTLGSLAIALLKLYSPATIVAYGVRPEELELALELGGHDARLVTQLRGPDPELDLVVETAGHPSAIELATQICRPGGRAALLGISGEGQMLNLPADLFAARDMSLVGSVAYTTATWAQVAGLVANRVLDLERIVTHRFPVSEYDEAVHLMDHRQGIVAKIVLEHE
ncbi:MAG: alcohol dehydrogenase catalytic domain-containing protein [Solirubrobacterales bacterium]|nr:alcohol dehydrogenase catalytic domain-containing protein [Solirubrobacterales bacterium]MBV9166754.1 alcohol dehydrogenase catalytic domain-containing protein [Solirubrobacterales bacterium]MBV9535591.1 alcohol dehydrogenase catalytic domain-containing protein [Solirubrobacterales bacterium]